MNELSAAVIAEFSDVPDLGEFARITIRLTLAAVLGFALGFERERKGKAAGVRTHMLVSIGSAMFVLVPQLSGADPSDMSRVIQGLVAGVGFLCAGTILKQSNGNGNGSSGGSSNGNVNDNTGADDEDQHHVQGLTTAAGLWMTAAIGMACGLGRESTAVLSTMLALIVLAGVPRLVDVLERRFRSKR